MRSKNQTLFPDDVCASCWSSSKKEPFSLGKEQCGRFQSR